MVQLNHNIKIGDTVNIGAYLSWQIADARVSGNYRIINIVDDYASLKREGDGRIIQIKLDTLSYLTGFDVDNAPSCQSINPKEYQPSINEEYSKDYLSEDSEELGRCYCGFMGDVRTVSIDLIQCPWCYISLPW